MSFPESLTSKYDLIEGFASDRSIEDYHVGELSGDRRDYMLRLLAAPLSEDPSVVNTFHEFFTSFAQISNKSYITQVYSVTGTVNGPVYALEEFFDGIGLDQFVEKNKTDPNLSDNIANIVTRVCEALHFAHQKNIFHLAVTPEDIRIDVDNPNHIKLTGFGTQILVDADRMDCFSKDERKQVAPEVAGSGSLSPAADIYCLAFALKEALPGMSNWSSLFAKCLSKKVSSRPQSARAYACEFKALGSTSEADSTTTSPEHAPGGLRPLINIRTEPEGATVRYDGKILGMTSSSGVRVPWKRGSRIELSKNGYEIQTLTLSDSLNEHDMVVKLKSSFRLFTNPWGAQALVDGAVVGETTREGLMVPWEGTNIEVRRRGYKSESLKFEDPPSETQSCIELEQVGIPSPTKRHPLELAGYCVAAILLWLLPVVIYSGLTGVTVDKTVSEAQKELTALVAKNRQLDNKLSESERESVSLKFSYENKLESAKKEIDGLRDQIRSQKNQTDDLRLTVGNLNKELDSKEQLISSTKKDFELQLRDIKRMAEKEKDDARRQIEELKNLASEQKESAKKISNLNDQVLGLRRELESKRNQNEQLEKIVVELEKSRRGQTAQPSARPKSLVPIPGLILHAMEGNYNKVEWLLGNQKADPDVANFSGMTPLMVAARNGHTEVVKLLISRGANINARDIDGDKAIDYARLGKQFHLESLLK